MKKDTGNFDETTREMSRLPSAVALLLWIERMIYIVAINGPEIQQQARLTLSMLSHRLAETSGKTADAYSLSDVAAIWRDVLRRGATFDGWVPGLGIVLGVGTGTAVLAGNGLLAGFLAMSSAVCFAVRGSYIAKVFLCGKLVASRADQLAEFERVMRWFGFEPESLGAMKGTLPEFRSWESLRGYAQDRLTYKAWMVLCWKDAPITGDFTEEQKTKKIREAQDDFFPPHRRLAACGLAEPKVGGYFDRARAKFGERPARRASGAVAA